MTTCYSCENSFSMPTDDFGGTTLLCSPDGEDGCQYAEIPCLKYQRADGADEPEEVSK